MRNYFLVLLTTIFASSTFAKSPDLRMGHFEDYIKKEKEINNKHPFLLFNKEDIQKMRDKMNDPYFKNYTQDLLYFADQCLQLPDDQSFPFTENPNFQTISETLVMAYLLTGDTRYSKKAIQFTKNFIDDHYRNVPIRKSGKFVDHLQNGNSISFILNTIAIVYDSLYRQMNDKERFLVRKGLAYFCKITYEMAITKEYGLGFNKNYRAGGMGALGLACLAIKDDVNLEAQKWLDKAMRVSIAWCNVAIKSDGVYPEGPTYLCYMLRNQLLFFEALKKNMNMDFFQRTNLKSALIWLIWESLPWQYEFDNFSDGGYSAYMHEMPFIFQKNYPGYGDYLIYKVYGKSLRFRSNPYALLFGKSPMKPTTKKTHGFFLNIVSKYKENRFIPNEKLGLSKVFKYGGVAGFRTGWSKNDMLLLTYATDYEYAAHSQADRGQFNIYAFNKKWAIDSGYGNDGKIQNSATPSEAHNIVLIDGKGEGFDPSMRQSGTFGEIVDFKSDDKIGYVKIDQKDAYDWYIRYSYKAKKTYNPVKKANRHILFVNNAETPAYAIVYDDIQKDDKVHNYTWQFHTAPSNNVKLLKNEINLIPMRYSGQTVLASETGDWDDFKSPGFNLFKHKAGMLSFKINAPKEDDYILWALGRGRPYAWGEVEVFANEKLYGRFGIGKNRDFTWCHFSQNKKAMHYPEMIHLNKGENTLTLKGTSSGYEIARMLFTTDKDFVPKTTEPNAENAINVTIKNLVRKEGADFRYFADKNTASCQVKMLYPQDCNIETTYYQPTKDTLHPRTLFNIKAVKPDFLAFIYPSEVGMEKPFTVTEDQDGFIKSSIKWTNYSDYIIVNKTRKEICFRGVKTDGKLLFIRFRKNKKIKRILVADAEKIQLNKGKVIDLSGPGSTIINY